MWSARTLLNIEKQARHKLMGAACSFMIMCLPIGDKVLKCVLILPYHALYSTHLPPSVPWYNTYSTQQNKVSNTTLKEQILPVAIFFAVSLVFSNKAYIYLSVSYIQMLKAATPIAVLVFSYFSGLSSTTPIELNIVAIISVGVAMTSIGESFFSWTGFTFQVRKE